MFSYTAQYISPEWLVNGILTIVSKSKIIY